MGLRSTFKGLTDKYSKRKATSELDQAYAHRVNRYDDNWRAYRRRRYSNHTRLPEDVVVDLGMVGSYVDRIVSFAHSKPWDISLDTPEGTEDGQKNKLQDMLAFVNKIDKANPREAVSVEIGYSCAITGDCFLIPQPELDESLLSEYQDALTAQEDNKDSTIKYIVVDPKHVYDFVLAPDRRTITYICFKIPVTKVVNGERQNHYFHQEITPETIVEYTTDLEGRQVSGRNERENPVGMVYPVHFKNYPVPTKWGIDDVDGMLGVVDQINKKVANISAIIDYHEEPTTVIFGARAKSLEKGANKLWSGLPANAKIETLANEADLKASVEFLAALTKSLQQQSGVNDAALGSEDLVSNVSGSAMQLRFYPLLSKAALKWASWNTSIIHLVKSVLLWGRQLKQLEFSNTELLLFINSLEVKFSSNLPTNEKEEIQNSHNKLKAGITSFEAELARHGNRAPEKVLKTLSRELEKYPSLMGLLGLQNLVTDQANEQTDDKKLNNRAPDGTPVDPPEEDET